MRETTLSLPEVALVAGTRVMLGAGLALLLGEESGGWFGTLKTTRAV